MKQLAVFLLSGLAALLALSAQAQTSNPNNTVVRFRIHYGYYTIGDIDLELFDQAKPVTVSNFLAYVRSGRYQNTLIHRLVPGFIIQSGEWTIPFPYSDEVFQNVTRVPQFDAIPNEFSVGPRLTNSAGTIAMAKLPDNPDSATASWFINLAYNGPGAANDLDNQNGGFTVFGKVIRDSNGLIPYFNSFSQNLGYLNMEGSNYMSSCPPVFMEPDGAHGYPFSHLPVQYDGFDCPYYNDLYRVQIVVLDDGDLSAPKITIASPKPLATITNEPLVIRGTVSENRAISTVRVYVGTNVAVASISNNTWSAAFTNVLADILPGTNTFVVEAFDQTGNFFGIAQQFFFSVRSPVDIVVVGEGSVAGVEDGQMLEIGRGYTLTATAASGHLFAGWTGPFNQAGNTYPFIMETNLQITATFVPNLFPNVKGTYTGLFWNEAEPEQQSSGFLTLTVGDSGTYSAKILMNGKAYPFRGTFSPDGTETNLVTRKGTNDLLVRLALDMAGDTGLTGSITNNQLQFVNTNLGWAATIQADRNVIRPVSDPAPEAGKYTFLIPRDSESSGPPGDSFGTVTVSSKGSISLSGTLSDGTKVTQKAFLSAEGMWPLYVPLYKGKGSLVGWVTFADETTTDFSGSLNWYKQRDVNARFYANGFTNQSTILGSRFTAPTLDSRLIELENATVGFTNLPSSDDFANSVTIDAVGKVTNTSDNKLTMSISRATGLFNGSATPPGATQAIPFKGAILQKQNRGAGFFLNLIDSGAVELREE